jgi:hypothetical protein
MILDRRRFGDWLEFRRLCEIRCLSPNSRPPRRARAKRVPMSRDAA